MKRVFILSFFSFRILFGVTPPPLRSWKTPLDGRSVDPIPCRTDARHKLFTVYPLFVHSYIALCSLLWYKDELSMNSMQDHCFCERIAMKSELHFTNSRFKRGLVYICSLHLVALALLSLSLSGCGRVALCGACCGGGWGEGGRRWGGDRESDPVRSGRA